MTTIEKCLTFVETLRQREIFMVTSDEDKLEGLIGMLENIRKEGTIETAASVKKLDAYKTHFREAEKALTGRLSSLGNYLNLSPHMENVLAQGKEIPIPEYYGTLRALVNTVGLKYACPVYS